MVRLALALLAVSSASFAALTAPVPEVDANMGVSAITMLAGGALVLRSRFGKKK